MHPGAITFLQHRPVKVRLHYLQLLQSRACSQLGCVWIFAGNSGSVSSTFVGSSGYVPPTPPVRKRLTRKNSGPLVSPARSSRALHLPTATGPDSESVRWTNEMLYWLHNDLVVLDELLAVWVDSLNDFVASAIAEVIQNLHCTLFLSTPRENSTELLYVSDRVGWL